MQVTAAFPGDRVCLLAAFVKTWKGFFFSFRFTPQAWKTVGGLCNRESICVCGGVCVISKWVGLSLLSILVNEVFMYPDAIDIQGQEQ